MTDYNVEGRLITKDDWEKWLKSKEEESDRRLSTMPEPSAKKESRYAVIEWHKYPQEKPKKDDEYLVSVNMWNKSSTLTSHWISSKDVFKDLFDEFVYAWAEIPEPYKEEEMVDEKIKEIAYHYGIERQLMKLSEKCSELANEAKLCSLNKETSSRLAEMMAEVMLLFSQISYLTLSIDRSILSGWLERKVDEQLERIKYGEDE